MEQSKYINGFIRLTDDDGEHFDFPSAVEASVFLGRSKDYLHTRRRRGHKVGYSADGKKFTFVKMREVRMHDTSIDLKNPDDGYKELANAIVLKAVEDYRALKQPKNYYQSEYDLKVERGRIKQIERFFLSGYGNLLCYGNGEYILEGLRNESYR